jgi:hypothetical protein
MRLKLKICVGVVLLLNAPASPQPKRPPIRQINPPDTNPQYFPHRVFGSNIYLSEFRARWYAKELRALAEPSLFERENQNGREVYRVLVTPSFQRTLVVRLQVREGGTGWLTAKMSAEPGTGPGHMLLACLIRES